MKKMMLIFWMLSGFTAFSQSGVNLMNIGDAAVLTNVKMNAVTGESVSLSDEKMENGLLVLFSANACPFVHQWENRYLELRKLADKNKVGMIVLNSNHQNRDGADSFDEMKKRAREQNYNFRYVVDADSRIANSFGGQTTPHVFLFNKDWKLVYKGAIDDNYESADAVKNAYVKDAIVQMSAGQQVSRSESNPVGCSIKRKLD